MEPIITGTKPARKKVGLLLSTPPNHPNRTTVTNLAETAIRAGHDVYLYLIDEGTRNLDDPELQRLRNSGLKLFACAYGAQKQDVAMTDQAVFCGLVVLSDLIKGCNPFLSFN